MANVFTVSRSAARLKGHITRKEISNGLRVAALTTTFLGSASSQSIYPDAPKIPMVEFGTAGHSLFTSSNELILSSLVPDPQQSTRAVAPPFQQGVGTSRHLGASPSKPAAVGSVYIPLDSWIYGEAERLYSLGYLNTLFLGMRPWTRQSLHNALLASDESIRKADDVEARRIYLELRRVLNSEDLSDGERKGKILGTESIYFRLTGIKGSILRDSYHLGQSISNDYGRLYQPGVNPVVGTSFIGEAGRVSIYLRGEYEHSPAASGYPATLANYLSALDQIPYSGANGNQATIPAGPIIAGNAFRLLEAALSVHLLGHEITGGKSDAWLGPARGGAMAWSNNAENIYSFRIDRVEPLSIRYLSRVLGPVRYQFFYGSLKGHTDPNHPYTHSEMFSFRPTSNFEFAFERTIIFGGAEHSPVTIHTFLKGFFDLDDTTGAVKFSRLDPGARFSDFTASYRLPFIRQFVTFYVDSFTHDDVTPISAPRRAAFRTGLEVAQLPGLRSLEMRVEAASTDPKVSASSNGQFIYQEAVQRQGYTNKGFIFGDSVGREGKGGDLWLTYHISPKQLFELQYTNKKNDKDFSGGSTQNQVGMRYHRLMLDSRLSIDATLQLEAWKTPIYLPGRNNDTIGAFTVSYYPTLKAR